MVSMSLAMPTLANRVITRGYMEILFFKRGVEPYVHFLYRLRHMNRSFCIFKPDAS